MRACIQIRRTQNQSEREVEEDDSEDSSRQEATGPRNPEPTTVCGGRPSRHLPGPSLFSFPSSTYRRRFLPPHALHLSMPPNGSSLSLNTLIWVIRAQFLRLITDWFTFAVPNRDHFHLLMPLYKLNLGLITAAKLLRPVYNWRPEAVSLISDLAWCSVLSFFCLWKLMHFSCFFVRILCVFIVKNSLFFSLSQVKSDFLDALSNAEKQVEDYKSRLEALNDNFCKVGRCFWYFGSCILLSICCSSFLPYLFVFLKFKHWFMAIQFQTLDHNT